MNSSLITHSHFSLLWGTSSPAALCALAKTLGWRALAITDTDNLYGLWPFVRHARQNGLRPMVGATVTEESDGGERAVCLVETGQGYKNLCRLISRRHRQREAFRLGDALPELGGGLTVLATAPALLERLREAGLALAVPLDRRPSGVPARVRKTARRLDLPMVAVPGSALGRREEHGLHRVLRAIALGTTLVRLPGHACAPEDAYLAAPADYRRRFATMPEALRNAEAVAERCTFAGPATAVILPPWNDLQGSGADAALREQAYRGARWRYGEDLTEAAVERLEHELSIIAGMGFSSYFLVVREIVGQSPRICGRGSGAASLVAYCLRITNVCPLKHGLYFERFLNPGRSDPPDIDVDFAWDERDDLLAWVLERHAGHAAMVCNQVLFQPRLAIREAARAHGITEREISRVVKRLPMYWSEEARGRDPLDAARNEAARSPDVPLGEPWLSILRIAQALIGTPRHLSVHSGGMIITPRPISDYVPIQTAPKGVPIVQWEKDGVEEGGLVKIDLLGNRSLGVIRDAIASLSENGVPFDESRWEPEDDPATQDVVARGGTMGCFYIESPAMRLLQQKTGKGDFEHLVIHSSIIRPAANEYIREYVRRLRGGAWLPLHPLLAGVLRETYGIMVYQEDVSRTAVAMAGFSHVDADALRKILGKKDKEVKLTRFHEQFLAGARRRGVDRDTAEEVWRMMRSFEGYSFCKPHSASYARVSFQAAYLKVHHPAEFMAAVISNQGGFYSTFAYVSEARRLGLTVLPPDVNRSRERWRGQGRRLRVGLQSIKALGQGARGRVIQQRQRRPFRGFDDFMSRVRPDEEEARALINAGACDALAQEAGRAELLWRLLRWRRSDAGRRPGTQESKGRGRGKGKGKGKGTTGDLFAGPAPVDDPALPPDETLALLRRQYETLGFLCDRHPMVLFARQLARAYRGIVKARDLHRYVGRRARVAGWLIAGKLVPTKKGEPMEFLTFEDETALVETTFFPDAYRRFCHILDWKLPYVLEGTVEEEFGAHTFTVDRAQRLERTAAHQAPRQGTNRAARG